MTGVTVTWTTSANSVATVDAAGVVTGVGNGTAKITASAESASGSVVVTVAQEVASVEVSPSMARLTAGGETLQLATEALDANGHAVAVAEFSWETSDPWVATVSEGTVTAVGGGNAMITVAYEGRRTAVPVSVRVSTRSTGTVRVLYAVPSDVDFIADASEGITHAIVDVQSWYRRELGGLTFSIYEATPEECRMSQPSDFYARYSWDKVLAAVQHCAPVKHDDRNHVWIVYADVLTECGPWELGGDQLGRGWGSITILPQWDLLGVAGGREFSYCTGDELSIGDEPSGPHSPESELPGRWTGGLAHELAHAFGLSHPPGCDQGNNAICDFDALLHVGYPLYPGTYLRSTDKEILMRSHFFNPDLGFLSRPPASLGLDRFYQKYMDADGLPIVASSVVPDRVLFTARDIIDEMLALRPDLRSTIAAQGVRVAVMAHWSVLTDLPEFSHLTEHSPGVSWDERTRGGGVEPTDTRPVVAIAEENLLCYGGDDVFPYEDIFVHVFAHAVLNMGIERLPGGEEFRGRLEVAYAEALDAGLWENTNAAENPDEYWAEGVQSWFGLNDPPGEMHNEVNTRAELEAYDPVLASLIREVFGDVTVSASCHETIDLKQ